MTFLLWWWFGAGVVTTLFIARFTDWMVDYKGEFSDNAFILTIVSLMVPPFMALLALSSVLAKARVRSVERHKEAARIAAKEAQRAEYEVRKLEKELGISRD